MKVLIVGLGSIGRKHLQVLRELVPTVIVYALRSKQSETEEGIFNIYSIVEIPQDVDFAIIATPTILHKEIIKDLIKLNIPLFIEKPSLHQIDSDTFDFLRHIEENNIFTYVGCNLRFHPCIQYLRDFLNNSDCKVNEVNVYCGSHLPSWRPNRNFREVYSAIPELGGGVHLDLIHELDYTFYLFGEPLTSKSILRSNSTLNIEAVDYAHYTLEYPTFVATVTLNYFRKKTKRQIEVVLEDETYIVDLVNSTIMNDDGVLIFKEVADQLRTLKLQMEYFIKSYNKGNKSLNSFQESINVLKICLNQ